jgi:hypothetical protein
MKTFFMLAAVAAALAATSAASANEAAGGHWEWRSQPNFGPKSTGPSRVRVWEKDRGNDVANCDCPTMKIDRDNCMMTMRGKGGTPSAG